MSIGQIVGELELPPLNMNTMQFSLYGTTLIHYLIAETSESSTHCTNDIASNNSNVSFPPNTWVIINPFIPTSTFLYIFFTKNEN